MRLTTEQGRRYQTIMTSLLDYADHRLRVTQALPPGDAVHLAGERAILVGRELWRNLDIIDAFVADNPSRLPDAYLDTARAWRDGIPARCIPVARDAHGDVTVETEAGTFVVKGVISGLSGDAPDGLGAFRTALLPLDDVIVCGTPVDIGEPPGRGELAWMRARAQSLGLTGVARSADDLRRRAGVYGALREAAELEGLSVGHIVTAGRKAPSTARQPPRGFHRSACFGESSEKRLNSLRGRFDVPLDLPQEARSSGTSATDEVLSCARACSMLYGVISLVEAYEQYVAISSDPCSLRSFREAVKSKALVPSCGYVLWEHEGVCYLMAVSLSDDEAFERALDVVMQHKQGHVGVALDGLGGESESEAPSIILDDEAVEELGRAVRDERGRMRQARLALLQRQVTDRRRPLERRMVEQGMTRYLLGIDAVVTLCDYLDAHVPDGRDDRLFPIALALSIVYMFVSCDACVSDAYDALIEYDMMRCEGTEWSHTLGRLVVNVYNSLPRWERSGWSLRQISERLTGRRMFYAADGSVLRVGRDDPCPCGSGQRYRRCCGR